MIFPKLTKEENIENTETSKITENTDIMEPKKPSSEPKEDPKKSQEPLEEPQKWNCCVCSKSFDSRTPLTQHIVEHFQTKILDSYVESGTKCKICKYHDANTTYAPHIKVAFIQSRHQHRRAWPI